MPPFATDDVTTYRKIDVNDGVSKPSISPKVGWAAGQQISYWDLGLGKRGAAPAYVIASCNGGAPEPTGHPVIVDSIPGDSDYSPFRALLFACKTDRYKDEVLPSLDALNDAIDLGLITDPTSSVAMYWVDQAIITNDVSLLGGLPTQSGKFAFYRGTTVSYVTMEPQEGQNPFDGVSPVLTGNVYEIVKPGSMAPVKVIFSQPFRLADGNRNPKYTPAWVQVTVTLKQPSAPPGDMAALSAAYDAVLAGLTKEGDLVTVGMNNALTVVDTSIIQSAVATTNRVNRPFVVVPGAM